jgi:hypothetical protein
LYALHCSILENKFDPSSFFNQLIIMFIISSNKEKGLYMEYDRSTILQVCLLRPYDSLRLYIDSIAKWQVMSNYIFHLYSNILIHVSVVYKYGTEKGFT